MSTVLAIAAHPDDIELLMSGTLMLLRDAGWQVHYMNVANGCCGTTQYDAPTIAGIRRQEAMAAAAQMGATFHESMVNDIEIFYDKPTLAKVASVVRQVAPRILLTHSPTDYMEDHTQACRLAISAAFCRGMPNFPVDPPCDPIPQPVTVYHAQPYSHRDPLGQFVRPDMWVDVTDYVDRKVDLLAMHASQKRWLDESQGHDSYLQTLRDLDAEAGRAAGCFRFAEGWRRHLHVGLCGPDDDPLRDALRDRVVLAKRNGQA